MNKCHCMCSNLPLVKTVFAYWYEKVEKWLSGSPPTQLKWELSFTLTLCQSTVTVTQARLLRVNRLNESYTQESSPVCPSALHPQFRVLKPTGRKNECTVVHQKLVLMRFSCKILVWMRATHKSLVQSVQVRCILSLGYLSQQAEKMSALLYTRN